MSARGHHGNLQGASHHLDLFESNTGRSNSDNIIPQHEEEFEEEERILHETYGAVDPKEDPLQLEHMMGFGGDYRQTIEFIPGEPNLVCKRYT
jgi:hypothetical protein